MDGWFLSVKISKVSDRGWRSVTGGETVNVSWWQRRGTDTSYTSIAITTVNQRASETGVISEKLRLRLNVVGLWDSRKKPAIVLLPSAWSIAEAGGEVVPTGIDDHPQAIAEPLGWGVKCERQRGFHRRILFPLKPDPRYIRHIQSLHLVLALAATT